MIHPLPGNSTTRLENLRQRLIQGLGYVDLDTVLIP